MGNLRSITRSARTCSGLADTGYIHGIAGVKADVLGGVASLATDEVG